MEKTEGYNGWRNRQTLNVIMWIGNDEPLYGAAVEFLRRYKGRAPYAAFIRSMGMQKARTPDNIAWLGSRLCYSELNEAMRDLIED
jgi:hypothetical protein